MKLKDLLTNLAKTYNSLVDKAKVPDGVWKPQADLSATDKDFFVRDGTGVISGALDQALEEAKDLPELVGLGLSVVSDPQGAYNQLINFAQQMDWQKAQDLAQGIAKQAVQYDNFSKGGKYARYATGRVGVTLALIAASGGGLLAMVQDVPNRLRSNVDLLANWLVDLSKVRKISGRFPINSQMYAGKKYSFEVTENLPLQAKYAGSIPPSVSTRLADLKAKYPNGVDFDEYGFARFEPYTVSVNGIEARVNIQTAGNSADDFIEADRLMGINKAYRDDHELVWHHVEDTRTMILVPRDIHREVRHTGGIAVHSNDVNLED
jgi:hypothetical protein